MDFIADDVNDSVLLPVIGENETMQYFFDEIAQSGLNQVNHVKNKQNAYLDLLFTNSIEDFCVSESVMPLWKNETYHTAIEYSFFIHNFSAPISWEYEIIPEYDKTNYDQVKCRLNEVNWRQVFNNEGDVDYAVQQFYEIINDIIIDCVPFKKRRRNQSSKHPVWYNQNLKHLKNKKQKCHKNYKKENSALNLKKYQDSCNELNLAQKSAFEEDNFKTESEIKSNLKKFFNYVKSKITKYLYFIAGVKNVS